MRTTPSLLICVALAAIAVPLCNGYPFLSHPLEAEVMPPLIAMADRSPEPATLRCFAIHPGKRRLSRDCLVSFLRTAELRVVGALPVIQGNVTSETAVNQKTEIVHEVLSELRNKVAAADSELLTPAFVDEILLTSDIVSDQPHAFDVMFDDFTTRGGEAFGMFEQLQYDPGASSTSGLSVFASGLISPPMPGMESENTKADNLDKYSTFKELVNPSNCSEADRLTKPECMPTFPIKDDRFEKFERWEQPVTREYIHEPLEEALHDRYLQDKLFEAERKQARDDKDQRKLQSVVDQANKKPVLLSVAAYNLN
eukprot:c107_g1_i1.p1 GENE.c107_g1_i1~~c107_g1_i1.p1  ORF type:complete len:329 (-),score=97.52 c107_g1_i1:199-1134(-)